MHRLFSFTVKLLFGRTISRLKIYYSTSVVWSQRSGMVACASSSGETAKPMGLSKLNLALMTVDLDACCAFNAYVQLSGLAYSLRVGVALPLWLHLRIITKPFRKTNYIWMSHMLEIWEANFRICERRSGRTLVFCFGRMFRDPGTFERFCIASPTV